MIIGLCGYKGSGKTTLCNYLKLHISQSINHIGFADPLYKMLAAMGVEGVYDKKQWDVPQEILNGKTIRYACQTLGTEWGRTYFGENIWAEIAVKKALMSKKPTIIDNVRYLSEYQAIVNSGGKVISFNANNDDIPDLSHTSESEIQNVKPLCHYTFTNDFTQSVESNALELYKLIMRI